MSEDKTAYDYATDVLQDWWNDGIDDKELVKRLWHYRKKQRRGELQ